MNSQNCLQGVFMSMLKKYLWILHATTLTVGTFSFLGFLLLCYLLKFPLPDALVISDFSMVMLGFALLDPKSLKREKRYRFLFVTALSVSIIVLIYGIYRAISGITNVFVPLCIIIGTSSTAFRIKLRRNSKKEIKTVDKV